MPGWKTGDWTKRGEVVYAGSRFLSKSTVEGKGCLRKIVSRVYKVYGQMMFKYASGKHAPHDSQCPFKCFRVEWLNGKWDRLKVDRWSGDIELLLVLDKPVVSFPIYFEHMRGGSIKTSTAWEMLIDTWRVAKRERKIRQETTDLYISSK
jgi:hypothetical protein